MGRLAKADDEAANLGMGSGKYIHLEYLSWMGDDLLMGPDEGDIRCNCCQNLIGSWSWIPHERHTLMGALETPLLRVLKDAVQAFSFYLFYILYSYFSNIFNYSYLRNTIPR